MKIIAVGVAGRIVADFIAVLILSRGFVGVFFDIQIHTGHLREIDNIGISLSEIFRPGHHEFASILIDENFHIATEGRSRMESGHSIFIGFSVIQLFLNLRHRAVFPVGKPG